MQIIAMLTMLIDHVGIVFFPEVEALRIIGRLAFPLYAYLIVVGWDRTSSRKRYVLRLLLIGLAAQLPYVWMIGGWEINVIGTFLVVLAVFVLLDKWKSALIVIPVIVLAILFFEYVPFDYGSYALVLMLIYRYLSPSWMFSAHLSLNFFNVLYTGVFAQVASVLATILLVYGDRVLQLVNRLKIPRIVWLSFYPVHMLVLVGCAEVFS